MCARTAPRELLWHWKILYQKNYQELNWASAKTAPFSMESKSDTVPDALYGSYSGTILIVPKQLLGSHTGTGGGSHWISSRLAPIWLAMVIGYRLARGESLQDMSRTAPKHTYKT